MAESPPRDQPGSASTALLARRQGRYRPFFILTTIIFLLVPLSGIVESRGTPLHTGLGILAIVLVVATLAPPLVGNWQAGRTGPVPVLTSLAIAGIAAYLMAQTGLGSWISLFYFAAIVASRILPERRAMVLLALIGALCAISMVVAGIDVGSAAVQGLSVALIGFVVFSMHVIRVLLAEDQSLVRGALAALLDLEGDIEVVAQVARGDEVVPAALTSRPDVALLDIEMPGLDGLAAAAQMRSAAPATRVIMVTTFGRPGYLRRAMDVGAAGFLLKDAPASELAGAIRRVAAGQRVVDPGLAVAALSEGGNPLSEREREVLVAARELGTIAEIAGRLSLSEGTVRNHLSSAIQKVGARNRAEAARIADDKGWLEPVSGS